MRAQEFITDALVHRAHVGSSDPNDIWHVRDDTTRKLRSRRNQVVLANAQPVVMSADAMRSRTYNIGPNTGKRYQLLGGYHYAYLQGDLKSQFPDNVDQGRQLWFKNGRFIYADTQEPFTRADYVHFAPDRTVTAYNVEQGNKLKEALHFVRPGELRGSYSDQQMQQMGFRRAQNGAWFIDQRRWDALVQQGKLREQQGVAEGKITLSTDPNWYGATVDNYQASGPVVNIPANQLVGFEPDDKMNQPKSKVNVEKIVAGLKQGAKLPPLLVRKYKNGYQVLDGHHRFWAYKLLSVKSIPAQIVPDSDIEEISKQGVAENFADGKVKGKSRPGRVKRSGASCNGSVTDLRARAKRASGEKAKMYHWCANMKSGRKK
jgi:hypothetical protein